MIGGCALLRDDGRGAPRAVQLPWRVTNVGDELVLAMLVPKMLRINDIKGWVVTDRRIVVRNGEGSEMEGPGGKTSGVIRQ